MLKGILRIMLGAVLFAPIVYGQDGLTGKWQGTTPNGTEITFDFKVDGSELTGKVTRNEESAPIEKGKVSKNTFTFSATLGGQPEALSGELNKDEVTIWLDRQGRERAVVLKRVKDQ